MSVLIRQRRAEWLQCLPCKCEGQSSDAQDMGKHQLGMAATYDSVSEGRDGFPSLAGWTSLLVELCV